MEKVLIVNEGKVLSEKDMITQVTNLLNSLPIQGKSGFSNKKGIDSAFAQAQNGRVIIREDDYNYLVERFNYALEHGVLVNYERWEDVKEMLDNPKKKGKEDETSVINLHRDVVADSHDAGHESANL
jgi:hypothetical protein